MTKRMTVRLDDEVYERLQDLRGRLISETKKGVSMTQLINALLSDALKRVKIPEVVAWLKEG